MSEIVNIYSIEIPNEEEILKKGHPGQFDWPYVKNFIKKSFLQDFEFLMESSILDI